MGSTTVTERLEGKVALITGGASGIGAYTAKTFVNNGAKVMIADIQDDLGRSICHQLGSHLAKFIHCDVTNEADIKRAVDTTVAQYGKLDIMFNNAGIIKKTSQNIVEVDISEFEDTLRVNLLGPFLGTKHAARVMIPAQSGSIINTASVTSVKGGIASHAYTSSKHGVLGLTRNTAVELGRHGIRVNCVSPYVVPTPLVEDFFGLDEQAVSKVHSTLKGKYCQAEDVAEAVVYLASDESKYVSGHNLLLDGGFSITNAGFCMFHGNM